MPVKVAEVNAARHEVCNCQRPSQTLVAQLRPKVISQPDQKIYGYSRQAQLNQGDRLAQLSAEIGGKRVKAGRDNHLAMRIKGRQRAKRFAMQCRQAVEAGDLAPCAQSGRQMNQGDDDRNGRQRKKSQVMWTGPALIAVG